jgi:hypothetical protein
MIGGPARSQQQERFLSGDPSDVSPQPRGVGNQIVSSLRAKHAMNEIANVSVGHTRRIRIQLSECGDSQHT